MIRVHRLKGEPFALNPDLFERVVENPDTTITLVDGTHFIVQESLEDLIRLVAEYRANIIRMSQQMEEGTYVSPAAVPARTETTPDGATIHHLPVRER